MEKFPRLFKRAIPFKMNIKLEDFVKEYICMEQDIHIEDMQESVMQYGRMRQRIEDTLKEAKSLEEIKESFVKFKTKKEEQDYCQYRMNKLDVLKLKTDIHLLQQKIEDGEKDLKTQEENETVLEKKLEKLAQRIRCISSTDRRKWIRPDRNKEKGCSGVVRTVKSFRTALGTDIKRLKKMV